MRKIVVGVMGASDSDGLAGLEKTRIHDLAERLGIALAQSGSIVVTGATTGLTDRVARACRSHGGFALGVSPAENRQEHVDRYRFPEDAADVIVFTGFGLKGRNVVNVRSADIVILVGGATGTLNEFTIAYDEGKIIGVLDGSGGVADHIREIIGFCNKPSRGRVLFDDDPERLLKTCLEAFGSSAKS